MSEPVRITKLVLVCHDCRAGLEALGARVVDEGTTIALGHACETHPTRIRVQAQHPMRVAPSALREWEAAPVETDVHGDDERIELVMKLSAQLLTGNAGATDEEIGAAVGTARRIVRAVKGG